MLNSLVFRAGSPGLEFHWELSISELIVKPVGELPAKIANGGVLGQKYGSETPQHSVKLEAVWEVENYSGRSRNAV